MLGGSLHFAPMKDRGLRCEMTAGMGRCVAGRFFFFVFLFVFGFSLGIGWGTFVSGNRDMYFRERQGGIALKEFLQQDMFCIVCLKPFNQVANFTPSNLVAAQTRLEKKFTDPESRERVLPALKLGFSNANILIKSAADIRTREDRSVQAFALKRQTRVPGNQRTSTHTGPSGDSMSMPLNWTTYSDTFSISLKQMDNNIFSFQDAFDQNMLNCILNIHGQIESDFIAYLLAQRTQVVKTTTPVGTRVTWNPTNYVHEVGAGDQKQFFQLAKEVMVQNYYNTGTYDCISGGQPYVNASFWAAQGNGNAQNTAFQFTGLNIEQSTDLTDGNYPMGVTLVMAHGTTALIDWIPRQNRMGYGDYNSYLGGYGSFKDPYGTNITFAVHAYALRSDTSATNGIQQDNLMQFEISVDVAQALTPFSTSGESAVYEIAQL